jgi:hypothetical protein
MRRLRRRISRRARLIALAITGFALISVAPLGALFATWTTAKSLQVYATLGGGALAAVAAVMATKDEPRGQIPRRLPKGAEVFIGRERDLEKLRALYAEQTATGSSPSAAPASLGDSARARTILIHGQPGVGKRELARAFAASIEADHPDGSLYFDLATATVPKGPGEVLGAMLLALGVEPAPTTEERIRQFLTRTSRRNVLILLENATDLDQVKSLVPNHPGCTVVITSQRTLGGSFGPRSIRISLPDSSSAARMLYAHGSLRANTDPLEVAEVIELCGRLPSALHVGGQLIAGDPTALADLPARLRPEHGRLRALCGVDGPVEQEIHQAYDRLGQRDQRALRHLALVDSTTFLPWVLIPLLGLTYDEATAVMKRLAEVELVQRVAADRLLGIYRYRLHALTRSFARTELDERETIAEQETARQSLDAGFLAVTDLILARLEPGSAGPGAAGQAVGPVPVPGFEQAIAQLAAHPDHWVRAEYGNLVRGVEIAYREKNWALCWRIGARLGGCVPQYVDMADCRVAFTKAYKAANADGSNSGGIRVKIAHASYLGAVEDYAAAFNLLSEVDQLISAYTPATAEDPNPHSLRAARLRTEGEIWLQAACYRLGQARLRTALEQAQTCDDETETRRIEVLAAEAASALSPEQWLVEPAHADDGLTDDRALFRTHLARAEWARRRMRWDDARTSLTSARDVNHGDARRRAAVEYRFAKLCLSQCRDAENPNLQAEHAADALVHAATAAYRFNRMHNHAGEIRARCMVVLAYIEIGELEKATFHSAQARQKLEALRAVPGAGESVNALGARVDRAEGLLEYCSRQFTNARKHLSHAHQAFTELGDWWAAAECELYLGLALHELGETTKANARLWAARDAFESCGDEFNLSRVKAALGAVALDATPNRRHRHGPAVNSRPLTINVGVGARHSGRRKKVR